MSLYTGDDLRRALREEACAGEVVDPWPALSRSIAHHRHRRRLGASAAAAAVVAAGLGVGLSAIGPGRRFPPATSHIRGALVQPASYQAACASEPTICTSAASGAIPQHLYRPLHLPRLAAGEACPTSVGTTSDSPYVAGLRFGTGPVYMEIGNRGNGPAGKVTLGTTQVRGWFAIESVWLSTPGYQGPFVVRGEQLDGSGAVGFGGSSPVDSAFVVPPGPGPNGADGYRFSPGSVWVTSPGCYGLQVDGSTFSETVVVEALPAATSP